VDLAEAGIAVQGHSENKTLDAFLGARRRLFDIANLMLGSAAEAEELVLDGAAFLERTTARLAINSAQPASSLSTDPPQKIMVNSRLRRIS
jgi:hypothetical protein